MPLSKLLIHVMFVSEANAVSYDGHVVLSEEAKALSSNKSCLANQRKDAPRMTEEEVEGPGAEKHEEDTSH